MHQSILEFATQTLLRNEQNIYGKRILEVGSCNINGSVRDIVEPFKPSEYIGIDVNEGNGVDVICSAEDIQSKFDLASFDGIICTEALEHVRQWWRVIEGIRLALKPGGWALLTTRSEGFPYHPFDEDNWRYSMESFYTAVLHFFNDVGEDGAVYNDPQFPGVFAFFKYDYDVFTKRELAYNIFLKYHKMHNMITGSKISQVEWYDMYGVHPINRFPFPA